MNAQQILHKNKSKLARILFPCVLLSTLMSSYSLANEPSTEPLTTVYKVTGKDGSVSFSDQPNTRSETIFVPPVPTVPAIDPQVIQQTRSTSNTQIDPFHYTSLSILSPAHDSAFYATSGNVNVSISVQPALRSDDTLSFYLDSQLISSGQHTQIQLPQVNRGTHTLHVKVLSKDNQTLLETSSRFTVHKPGR